MMRIALFQGPEQAAQPADNLVRLEQISHTAAQQGARLLILPELFLTGYNIGSEAIRRLAEPRDGPAATRAAAIAREAGIALVYGYPERGANGDIYNAALLLDRTGKPLASYRKTHLFGSIDRDVFTAGTNAAIVAELEGRRLGLLICYDVEFPETTCTLALAGVDLIVVPTALMEPYEFIPRCLVAARAYENQVFLAYANRCGQERELRYYGLSCVVGPDGKDLARAGSGEQLLVADLDFDLLRRSRQINTYQQDRRPELYRELVTSAAQPHP